jgi:Na+/melibiose symporter-like transporter
MTESRETSFKTKMYAYSFPRVFSNFLIGTIGFSLLFLYSLAYNVNTILVGFGQALGYFSIAAGQFLLGWLSDGKYTRENILDGAEENRIFLFLLQ